MRRRSRAEREAVGEQTLRNVESGISSVQVLMRLKSRGVHLIHAKQITVIRGSLYAVYMIT